MKWAYLLVLCSMVMNAKAERVNIYGIILAGGVGERLWPLSRQGHPKQFLSVGSKENLLQQALTRFEGVISKDATWVVTSQLHASYISKHMQESVGTVLVEPYGRNTGPALLYACMELYKKDPTAVALFTPADPYIPESDYDTFRSAIKRAVSFAQSNDGIVLCGVKPTYAATGYGYIEHLPLEWECCFKVERFHEKPSAAIAKQYMQQKNMLWNIGIFVAKVSVFLDEFRRVAPELYQEFKCFQRGEKSYKEITSISVDCAVIERSNRTWVLPVNFSWCDVGNLDVYLSIKDQKEANLQKTISIDSHNNVIDVPNKMVALIGVDDLCVVETDDALLISKRSQAEKVRAVVAQLKQNKQIEYL